MAEDIFGKIGSNTGQETGQGIGGAVGILRGLAGEEKETETESLGAGAQFLDFLKFLDELFPDTAEQMEGTEPGQNIFMDFLKNADEQKKLLQEEETQSSLVLPKIDLASLFINSGGG